MHAPLHQWHSGRVARGHVSRDHRVQACVWYASCRRMLSNSCTCINSHGTTGSFMQQASHVCPSHVAAATRYTASLACSAPAGNTPFLVNPQRNSLCTRISGLQQELPASVQTDSDAQSSGCIWNHDRWILAHSRCKASVVQTQAGSGLCATVAHHAAVKPIYPIHTCTHFRLLQPT